MAITDPLSTLKTLLNNKWTASNTDNVTPVIDLMFNVKRFGGFSESADYVLMYQIATTTKANAVGGLSRNVDEAITIEVSCTATPSSTRSTRETTSTRAHIIKVMKEVDRIMWANKDNPDSNYNYLDSINYGWMDLSSGMRNMFKFVRDVHLIKSLEVRA